MCEFILKAAKFIYLHYDNVSFNGTEISPYSLKLKNLRILQLAQEYNFEPQNDVDPYDQQKIDEMKIHFHLINS